MAVQLTGVVKKSIVDSDHQLFRVKRIQKDDRPLFVTQQRSVAFQVPEEVETMQNWKSRETQRERKRQREVEPCLRGEVFVK